MYPLEYRVFASNDEFPEGKMYYPETMQKEVDKNRGFVLNQFGNLVHMYYKNGRSNTAQFVWARVGFNNVEVMFALPKQKDINDKQIWEEDIVQIYGGMYNGKTGVVLYNEESAAFVVKGDDGLFQPFAAGFREVKFEVIGNTQEVKE